MNYKPIEIIDNLNQGRRIRAFLVEDPDDDYIEATDKLWRVYRERFANAQKVVPEHHHWSWKWKLQQELNRDSLFKCFGIIADDEPQGLMLLNYGREYLSRMPGQTERLLIYLSYIESAPWNNKEYCDNPRYAGVGKELHRTAVRFSDHLGFGGLVGLHSLPGVESFYENTCQMIPFGRDPNYENLVYFESQPISK